MKLNSSQNIALTCLCLVLTTSACNKTKYDAANVKVPEKWREQVQTPALDNVQQNNVQWWKNFNDPVLDDLVEKALAGGLDMIEAEARVREARALAYGAGAELLPQGNAKVGATRGSNSADLYEAGFDASWEIDIFGGNRDLYRARSAEAEATKEERDAVALTLVSEVARNYIELRLYQGRLRLAKKTLETQNSTALITQARYNEGIESDLELSRINSQLSTVRAQVPMLENLLGASVYRLEFLLGLTPGSLNHIAEAESNLPLIDPAIATDTPIATISRRPDVRAAEQRLLASGYIYDAAISSIFPKITLSSVLGFENNTASGLINSSNKVWSLGGAALMPLLDFGRIHAGIKATDAAQEQAFIQYRRAVLLALKETETAVLAYSKEWQRLEALTDAATASKKAIEISQTQYREGIISQLDVLQAQSTLFSAQTELLESLASVSYNLIALYKSLGLVPVSQ